MTPAELKEFLDEKVIEFNNPKFIDSDPIQIPHQYSLKEDIEISGFLTATISWGNRKMIIKNAQRMTELMGNSPFDFVMSHNEQHLKNLEGFVHRTFNSLDFSYFIKALQHIYKNQAGLESIFEKYSTSHSTQNGIHELKKIFFEIPHLDRTKKHISDPLKGSAAKRINILTRSIKVAKIFHQP